MSECKIVQEGRMTASQYRIIHMWVRKQLGSPTTCENCQGQVESTRFEWANLSGDYLYDPSDWAELCTHCHRLIDGSPIWATMKVRGEKSLNWNGNKCQKGHPYTPENTFIKRQVKKGSTYRTRICRECNKSYSRNFRTRNKLTSKKEQEATR